MSLIDTTFAPIPGPLLTDWGSDITYIKAATTETYNPTTGLVSGAEVSFTIRAIITQVNPEEFDSTYQTTDLKLIIGNTELGTYAPSIRDRIEYTDNSTTKTARIINVKTVRGDSPIYHTLIARPQ
jgi:hypothetical protein